jgi:hypothetical protein
MSNSTLQAMKAAMKARWDRGQTAFEYLGIILVVVVIIGAIVGTGIGEDITTKIGEQIDKIKAGE